MALCKHSIPVGTKTGRKRTVFKGASELAVSKQVDEAFKKMDRRPMPRLLDRAIDPELRSYYQWLGETSEGDN